MPAIDTQTRTTTSTIIVGPHSGDYGYIYDGGTCSHCCHDYYSYGHSYYFFSFLPAQRQAPACRRREGAGPPRPSALPGARANP